MIKRDIFEPSITYHIFNRGNNEQNIFLQRTNFLYFIGLMRSHLTPICQIYSYCLIKNHFHFLLRINDYEDLPIKYSDRNRIHLPFANLFNAYAKAFNKYYNRSGSVFQEHLKRIRVDNEKYLKQLIIYIHQNPVKHNFVSNIQNYSYSSYKIIAYDKESFINKKYVYNLFQDRENFIFLHKRLLETDNSVISNIERIDC